MIFKWWRAVVLLWISFRKAGTDFFDLFKPRGNVELRLKYADGPKKGQVARVIHGRNIVTNWLSTGGAAPTSGRDLMRRIIVPAAFAGSLAADPDATFTTISLGSGTTAETVTDGSTTDAPEVPVSGGEKAVTAVEFDASNSYVTFITEYSTAEVNVTLTEAVMLSGRGDVVARKTFAAFPKTSAFTLEVRWTFRF